ncbi:MAG: bactofilin family protein [Terriglobales bacterium]
MESPKTAEIAHIGRSVIIKGELSGSEDLYVDGQVEGTIELQGNSLTVGPNGQLRANVNAKNVIVHGVLEGNVKASERTDLRKSAVVTGDISSQKIAIEDGAYFKGKVDIQKESSHRDTPKMAHSGARSEPSVTGGNGSERSSSPIATAVAAGSSSTNTAPADKTPVTDQKKF